MEAKTLEELRKIAESKLTEIAAPLGLSEWQTTDGQVFYDKRFALATQVGIERRSLLPATEQEGCDE